MDMTEIKCKNCGAPIEEENIIMRLSMARCSHCNSIFSLSDNLDSKDSSKKDRLDVPMPEKIKISHKEGKLEISYKWFNFIFIFLIFFCIIWDGFMVVWHTISLTSGAWYMSLFGLLHTAVGIGLTYYTIAGFFNTTTVTAGMGNLEIRHHPVPWFGNKKIKTSEIRQFYSKEKISQGKNGQGFTYEIYALLAGQKPKVNILKGLQDAELALFIEQELEHYLGIKDEPVPGEIPR